jgi:hypothetical protein
LKKILSLLIVAAYCASVAASVSVNVNGTAYTIPQTGEKGWGTNVTTWIQAISANTLQPTGGSFTLSADVDFGSSFGLAAPYFKSKTSNIAGAGVLRLAHDDLIDWRNNANSANLALGVDSSDNLTWGSVIVPTATSASFQDSTFSLYDNGDSTKKIAFELSGLTTGNTRTLTVPDKSTTLVGIDTTDTLTNKTLTSPTVDSPTGAPVWNIKATDGNVTQNVEMLKLFRPGDSGASGVARRASMITGWDGPSSFVPTSTYTSALAFERDDANNTYAGNIGFFLCESGPCAAASDLTESARINGLGNLLVGVDNGGTVHDSARVQIFGTNRGFLPPVLTGAQESAMSSPTDGLQVYNSTSETPDYYDGGSSVWRSLVSTDKAQTLTNKTLTSPSIGTSLLMPGSSSGTITIQTQAAAGTYNFNLPTTAGSSGQVLTSAGGGSSAMTWSSVLSNPMTTAGDIIYSSSGTGTPARLAIGSTGQFLTVSGGLPAWGNLTQYNFLLNPDFRFYQATGSSGTVAAGSYVDDQWYALHSAAGTWASWTTVSGPTSINGYYSNKYGRLAQSNASANRIGLCQPIEAAETYKLRGKTVTFAFQAQEQTNITTLRSCIGEWTGTADSITRNVVSSWAATPTWIANFSCDNTPADQTISASWSQLSTTATISTSANNLIVCVWTPNTQAQNDAFNIGQAQLVIGSSALDWGIVARPESDELARLQRFYEKSYEPDTAPGTNTFSGAFFTFASSIATANNNNWVMTNPVLRVSKAKTPTISVWTNAGTAGSIGMDGNAAARATGSSLVSQNGFYLTNATGGSITPTSGSVIFHWVADSRL